MLLPFQWDYFHNVAFPNGIRLRKHWSRHVKRLCNIVCPKITRLKNWHSTGNPRIATTLFSSANPDNVLKNIAYAEEPADRNLVREVQEIIGKQMRVSWANS